MMRAMPSLIESKQKWNRRIVFQLNDEVAESVQAKELITTTVHQIHRRLQRVHPWHTGTLSSIVSREDLEHYLENLIAATELLEIGLKNNTSNI